jgi:hypothetical protein
MVASRPTGKGVGQHDFHFHVAHPLEGCRDRYEEVAGDNCIGMVSYDVLHRCPAGGRGRPLSSMYLPTVRESTKTPSLSDSSSAMRPSPQLGFSLAMVRMSACKFLGRVGRPGPRDFQRQNSRKPARCQRTNVLGLTIASAPLQGNNRLKTTSASFAAGVGRRRRPCVPDREQVAFAETGSRR